MLFYTSLLLSNLLLVLDQVLRHLSKLRLQSPPDQSHKINWDCTVASAAGLQFDDNGLWEFAAKAFMLYKATSL